MRLLLTALLASLVSACVTVTNTLAPEQVATFRLARIDVSVPDAARVSWGDGEVAYAATRGVAPQDSGSVASTPEGRAYVRDSVAAKLKTAFERNLAGALPGVRLVRLDVIVQDVHIASVVQRILIGGGHTLRASVTLVDAKTGAVLSSFPAQTGASGAGQGLGGALLDAAVLDAPIDRVTDSYAAQYRRWLLNQSIFG